MGRPPWGLDSPRVRQQQARSVLLLTWEATGRALWRKFVLPRARTPLSRVLSPFPSEDEEGGGTGMTASVLTCSHLHTAPGPLPAISSLEQAGGRLGQSEPSSGLVLQDPSRCVASACLPNSPISTPVFPEVAWLLLFPGGLGDLVPSMGGSEQRAL